jgi:hypothetical protein
MSQEKTVLENNILIAQFMGSTITMVDYTDYNEDGSIKYTANEDGSVWMVAEFSKPEGIEDNEYWGHWKHGHRFMYHTSWDWLMPVVEKIEGLGYEFFIVEDRIKIAHNTDHSTETIIDFTLGGSKRDATYKAVVEFINWCNALIAENPKPTKEKIIFRIVKGEEDNDLFAPDGGVAVIRHNGELMTAEYYQDKINPETDPKDIWEELAEGSMCYEDWVDEDEMTQEMIDAAIIWLGYSPEDVELKEIEEYTHI